MTYYVNLVGLVSAVNFGFWYIHYTFNSLGAIRDWLILYIHGQFEWYFSVTAHTYIVIICEVMIWTERQWKCQQWTHLWVYVKQKRNPLSPWYRTYVKSSQVFYFPKQHHIYTLRYTFKTMSVGMAKQRSIAYRAVCHGTKIKIQATGFNCRCNTENKRSSTRQPRRHRRHRKLS